MRTHPPHGGRHELGQNFLIHTPTITRVVGLVAATRGEILEIGAGDGALTAELAKLGRGLTAIDVDGRRVARLRRRLPGVRVEQADVLRHSLNGPVVVGNIPFHITTPILRHLLDRGRWRDAVLLTQWEVARKRAGVGGGTMMTAQAAPWFAFALQGRVPAWGFRPAPSVDGGLLTITRRASALVPVIQRPAYEQFVRTVFAGKGRGIAEVLRCVGWSRGDVRRLLDGAAIGANALPRDLRPQQWAELWNARRPMR